MTVDEKIFGNLTNEESKYQPAPVAQPAVMRVPTMNRLSALTNSIGRVYAPRPDEKKPARPDPTMK